VRAGTRALDGIVVLDLGQICAGPYCTLLLRQLGATVVKIEPPGGEPIRWRPGGRGVNSAFLLLNAGKLGVELDLKADPGREAFRTLVASATWSSRTSDPGAMERLGLSYAELAEINPRIVVASGDGYPPGGAYRGLLGTDVTVQAMSGVAVQHRLHGRAAGEDRARRRGLRHRDAPRGGGARGPLPARTHRARPARGGRDAGRDPARAHVEHRRGARRRGRRLPGAHRQPARRPGDLPVQRLPDRVSTTFGRPLRMSGSAPVPLTPAPLLGEHTDDVL
jgi:crotonobetainyl-CoA:carnitine CoA-transferase CaiB-like acyl-CoA transferase